jgi:hypothetical protein
MRALLIMMNGALRLLSQVTFVVHKQSLEAILMIAAPCFYRGLLFIFRLYGSVFILQAAFFMPAAKTALPECKTSVPDSIFDFLILSTGRCFHRGLFFS